MGVCHTHWTWGEVRSRLALLNGSELRRGQGAPKKTARTRSAELTSLHVDKAHLSQNGRDEQRGGGRGVPLLATNKKGGLFLFNFLHPGLY